MSKIVFLIELNNPWIYFATSSYLFKQWIYHSHLFRKYKSIQNIYLYVQYIENSANVNQ